jgi:hypothetical protein
MEKSWGTRGSQKSIARFWRPLQRLHPCRGLVRVLNSLQHGPRNVWFQDSWPFQNWPHVLGYLNRWSVYSEYVNSARYSLVGSPQPRKPYILEQRPCVPLSCTPPFCPSPNTEQGARQWSKGAPKWSKGAPESSRDTHTICLQ